MDRHAAGGLLQPLGDPARGGLRSQPIAGAVARGRVVLAWPEGGRHVLLGHEDERVEAQLEEARVTEVVAQHAARPRRLDGVFGEPGGERGVAAVPLRQRPPRRLDLGRLDLDGEPLRLLEHEAHAHQPLDVGGGDRRRRRREVEESERARQRHVARGDRPAADGGEHAVDHDGLRRRAEWHDEGDHERRGRRETRSADSHQNGYPTVK